MNELTCDTQIMLLPPIFLELNSTAIPTAPLLSPSWVYPLSISLCSFLLEAAVKVDDEEKFKILHSIVYTTRLDEMNIFSKVRSTKDTDAVFEAIIKESKPNINRKRVRSNSMDANERLSAYEDLSLRINFVNKKARVNRHDKNLLRLCKPVRVVVEKLKIISNKDITENTKYRTLIPFFRINTRHKINILYDLQNNEIDVYFLDSFLSLKEYVRLQNIQSFKSALKELARSHENILTRYFCCWYARKNWLDRFRHSHGLETPRNNDALNFMRKTHKCSINNCLCCCSTKLVLSNENYTKNKVNRSENPRDWYNKMTERTDLMNTPIVKSFKNNNTSLGTSNINWNIKHESSSSCNSENIHINSKNQLPTNLLQNLCCWYKQEEVAGRFLADGGFKGIINFMRRPHLCSIMDCKCCCKPKKTQMTKLSHFDIPVRHTNNFTKYIDVKFLNNQTKPLNTRGTKPNAYRSSFVDKSKPEPVGASKPNPTDTRISNFVNVSRSNLVTESRPNIINVNRPSITNVAGPNIANVTRPNIANVTRPNIANVTRPNIANVTRPNIANVTRPNIANVTRPNIANVTRPNIVNVTRPSIANVTRPNIVNVTRPSIANVTRPNIVNVTRPSIANVTRPNIVNVTRPSIANVTRPNIVNVTRPSIANVTRPNIVNVTRPSIANVTRPNIVNVTRPSIANVIRPNIANVTRPSIANVTRPNIVNVTRPSIANVIRPNIANVTRPSIANVTQPNTVNVTQPNTVNVIRRDIVNVNTSNIVNVNIPDFIKSSNSKHETNSKKNNDICLVTFSISLTAFQYMLQHKKEAPLEEILNLIMKKRPTKEHKLDKFVNFIINTSHFPYAVAIEKIDMDSLTTKELLILDMIFNAIETFSKQSSAKLKAQTSKLFCTKETQTIETHTEKKDMSSLNEVLRATSFLRSHQFATSLEDHLRHLRLPKNLQLDCFLNDRNDPYKPVYRKERR
ncbi:unnamed protein product [Spodoptera littoralis]|uniref:Uncharacterized protein n=1 Tax=Spodoptera littoralis TaxID=7109 RepID=A0A9P0I6J6_SPOLI|nr:unnamed protein product [Spodoptera littoralis]CAH1640688.1 unnamed protein product [Spodoptera littoralis]